MATGPMFANIRWGTYALFAALNGLVIFPAVYLFFPETKKYSLEDVSLFLLYLFPTPSIRPCKFRINPATPAQLAARAYIQLDIIFALAHEEGKNPVSISLSGNIPEAGTPEADVILGRKVARPDMGEKTQSRRGHSFGASRIISREKDKRSTQHDEHV